MPFFALPLAMAAGYVAWLCRLRRKGDLKFDNRVVIVLLVAGLLSLRFVVVHSVLRAILPPLLGGDDLSFWFEDVLDSYAFVLYLLPLAALVVVISKRAMTNRYFGFPHEVVIPFLFIMVPAILFDVGVERTLKATSTVYHRHVEGGLSPDGRMQAHVTAGREEVDLYVESSSFPLVRRHLGDAGYESGCYVIWTNDSQVVLLWGHEGPLVGYDFSRSVVLKKAGYDDKDDEAFRVSIRALLDQHGCPDQPEFLKRDWRN